MNPNEQTQSKIALFKSKAVSLILRCVLSNYFPAITSAFASIMCFFAYFTLLPVVDTDIPFENIADLLESVKNLLNLIKGIGIFFGGMSLLQLLNAHHKYGIIKPVDVVFNTLCYSATLCSLIYLVEYVFKIGNSYYFFIGLCIAGVIVHILSILLNFIKLRKTVKNEGDSDGGICTLR